MKEWFNRTFFADEPLGDKILSILIGIFAILFVCGWAIFILWFILHSFFDFLKWTKKKDGIPDFEFEDKIDLIEEKIGNVFKLPLTLIPDSVDTFFYNNNEKVKLIKSIATGVSIPVVAALIWLASSSSPLNELLLITKGKNAKGYITKVEEQSEEVSYNDDRSHGIRYYYTYEYYFKLPAGTKITSIGSEDGEIPENLSDLNSEPYQVNVEYLASNPNICRVKEMESSNKTIWAWLRHRFSIGAIVMIFLIYWGVTIIRNGIKNYKLEKNRLAEIQH
jgi:hypothetical protein